MSNERTLKNFGEELVDEFYGRVQAYVRLRVPERDSEDIVGDIFLRALEKRRGIRGDRAAWLFSVARNRIADYHRRRAVEDKASRAAARCPDRIPASTTARQTGGNL